MPARRFPPPRTAEVTPNCFIVRDGTFRQAALKKAKANFSRRTDFEEMSSVQLFETNSELAQASSAMPPAQIKKDCSIRLKT